MSLERKPFRPRHLDCSYRKNISIECNTVDSFHGQEMDIIVVSCVREEANTFVNDAHRLNVALTRAKYGLYVVGTRSLFDVSESRSGGWRSFHLRLFC